MDTEEKMTLGALILGAVWELGKLAIYAYLLLLTIALGQKAVEALDRYNARERGEQTAPVCVTEA